jgi:tRNA (guanine-N7-)-methyltransferase
MFGNSTLVHSNQDGIHPDLLRHLQRHRGRSFGKPVANHTRQAFDLACNTWQQLGCPPLALDAACGTGWSSLQLAARFPGHLVIGVDQSEQRLARAPAQGMRPANLLLLRADVVDFWRLLAAARMRLARHYLLYPNPWPRKQHLMRRWHGHPAFGVLPQLGGEIECRSNWKIYVDEFALALGTVLGRSLAVTPVPEGPALTPFEEKYRASGHALWRCSATVNDDVLI